MTNWHPQLTEHLPLRDPGARTRRRWEIAIVLLLSLGASAIWAIEQFIDRLTRDVPIAQQQTSINPSRSDRAWLDLTYQLTGHLLDLVPVLLVCWLLWSARKPHLGRLGLSFVRPWRDTGVGAALVLAIGIPGLALYWLGRQFGITLEVVASPLDTYWWTVPILIVSALRAGLQEEVIVIGYLFERLRSLGYGRWTIIISSAVLRGSYHLYQGIGAFIGNVAMGILFGWLYTRGGRLLPLIAAHTLIDCAVFIGYPWATHAFPWFFGAS